MLAVRYQITDKLLTVTPCEAGPGPLTAVSAGFCFGTVTTGFNHLCAIRAWSLSAQWQDLAEKPAVPLEDESIFWETGTEGGNSFARPWRRKIVEILLDDKLASHHDMAELMS